MAELTDVSAEDIIVGQRVRIAELEQQLAETQRLARVAELELRAILAGCGSTEEQMRASVPVLALQKHLADALARPQIAESAPATSPEEIERAYVDRDAGELPDNIRPLRRPREQFYADVEPRGGK